MQARARELVGRDQTQLCGRTHGVYPLLQRFVRAGRRKRNPYRRQTGPRFPVRHGDTSLICSENGKKAFTE